MESESAVEELGENKARRKRGGVLCETEDTEDDEDLRERICQRKEDFRNILVENLQEVFDIPSSKWVEDESEKEIIKKNI